MNVLWFIEEKFFHALTKLKVRMLDCRCHIGMTLQLEKHSSSLVAMVIISPRDT